MTASNQAVMAALEQAIVRRIGEPSYCTWFNERTRFSWEAGLLIVGVANHFVQEWLSRKFCDAIRDAAGEVLGQPTQVRFLIDSELFQAARQREAEVSRGNLELATTAAPLAQPAKEELPASSQSVEPPSAARTSQVPKRRWHRLGDFVVGACNRVAQASALSVVEEPGQSANPLVVYGPVGTGKTHLLEGVYVGLRKSHPEWHVRFTSAEEFTNRFVQAMRLGKLGAFRKQFRECEALLVDDLHFLAKKRFTQEEFLHTFDALLHNGRQIMVTCDVHPRLAEEFVPELVDRLLGGALWCVLPPDRDTRLDILRAKSAQGDSPVPEDVLTLLADALRANVRELEGALHNLRHYGRLTGRPINLAMAREALADHLRHAVRVVQLADVDRAICAVLRLEAGSLQSRQRAWAVSHPRMLAMFLARKHTAASHAEIGQHFGGRNHSTVIAAEKKAREWLRDEARLTVAEHSFPVREVIERVERELLR